MTGAARHKDARTLRHTLDRLGELYRRSGGSLPGTDGAAIRAALAGRLSSATTLDEMQRADLALSLDAFVTPEARRSLEALPSSVEISGEDCPLDYEIEDGKPIVRIRMKEHLARRLGSHEVPTLDRPIAFTVIRGKHAAVRASSLQDLRRALNDRGENRRRSGSARKRRKRS
jgi:hypothetical protein